MADPDMRAVRAAEVRARIAERQAAIARLGAWGALLHWVRNRELGPAALEVVPEEPETWKRHFPPSTENKP